MLDSIVKRVNIFTEFRDSQLLDECLPIDIKEMPVISVKITQSDNKMYENEDCSSSTVELSMTKKRGVESTPDDIESSQPTVKKLKSLSELETQISNESNIVVKNTGLNSMESRKMVKETRDICTESSGSNELERQKEECLISDTTDQIVTTEVDQIYDKFPDNEDLSDILQSIKFDGILPSITDRYFTPYYRIDVQKPGNDICIRIHSNRICMISLAPSHAILQKGKMVTKVNFRVSDKLDRASNKVSGKSKHGAQPLQSDSNICSITCSDGQTYIIKCCLIGKLVEINKLLLENPKIVKEPPHKGGYLAIALPNIKLLEDIKKALLTQELYDLSILQRQVTSKDEISGDINSESSMSNDVWKKRLLKRKWSDADSTDDVSFNVEKNH